MIHYFLHEVLFLSHPIDDEKPLKELFLLLAAGQAGGSHFRGHLGNLIADGIKEELLRGLLLLEKLVGLEDLEVSFLRLVTFFHIVV